MWIPSPHHQLLQIVLQNLQEGFSRLAREVDIDRITSNAEGFDWNALVKATRDGGLQSAVAVSLQLSRRLLGTVVPPDVSRELAPSRAARFHLAIMRPEDSLLSQRLLGTVSASGLFELWLVRGFDQRMQRLTRQLGESKIREISRGKRPPAMERGARLIKLVAAQVLAYAAGIGSLVSRRGRVRSRFWSLGRWMLAGVFFP
jgi:hypothetical protein